MHAMNDADTIAAVQRQWPLIQPGDRLTMATPQGGTVSGRVVFKFPTHCVINCGGRYGRPAVVVPRNFVAHKPKR